MENWFEIYSALFCPCWCKYDVCFGWIVRIIFVMQINTGGFEKKKKKEAKNGKQAREWLKKALKAVV